MIRIIFLLILISLRAHAQYECNANYAALVLDDKNNKILFEKRAEAMIYPASLTKIMTLYLVFEALENKTLKLDEILFASANAEDISKVNKINTLSLKEGDQMTVEEAIKALTVRSFNEAAVMLAERLGGNEWQFVKMMNEKAIVLEMMNTNFRNASGLHEEGQYTTNYDLSRLVINIEKNFAQYQKYFALKEFDYKGIKYVTHNQVLLEYQGANGFKTGFTRAAGFNLIASAKRDGISVKSILTGCESAKARNDFSKELLDLGFKNLNQEKLSQEISQ